MQIRGHSAPCRTPDIPPRCGWKWIDIVDIDFTKRPSDRIKLVRGKDNGRAAWHYVLVDKELEENFNEAVASTGTVNVAKYGFVIHSGFGKDPPEDFVDKLKRCSPKYC